jgi:xanthine phosphoribosyltransferase
VSWDQCDPARRVAPADKGPFEAIVCITRGGGAGGHRRRELDLKLIETVCVASYPTTRAGG